MEQYLKQLLEAVEQDRLKWAGDIEDRIQVLEAEIEILRSARSLLMGPERKKDIRRREDKKPSKKPVARKKRAAKKAKAAPKLDPMIMEALSDGLSTVPQIHERYGAPKSSINRTMKRMAKDGEITLARTQNRVNYYTLNSEQAERAESMKLELGGGRPQPITDEERVELDNGEKQVAARSTDEGTEIRDDLVTT